MVMCGNSHRALQALYAAGAPITAIDIHSDPRIRQELATISGWPTIPQVFVKGELVGGADITEELAASGELQQKLDEALGADRAQDDKVVELQLAWNERRRTSISRRPEYAPKRWPGRCRTCCASGTRRSATVIGSRSTGSRSEPWKIPAGSCASIRGTPLAGVISSAT